MEVNAANQAHFRFESPNLHPDDLQIVDFEGVEGLSRLYRYEINLMSKSPDIPYESVINEAATLFRRRTGPEIKLHGIVSEFEIGAESSSWYAYHAVVVPRLWALTLTYKSQPYVGRSVPEIIEDVLNRNNLTGADYELRLSDAYEARSYCVQYKETDFNFISRLMEYEGIFYFFDHSDDSEKLVITDDQASLPAIPNHDVLFFHREEGMVGKPETISDFSFRQKLVTGKVVLAERNSETPNHRLIVESSIDGSLPGERYEHDQHFLEVSAGERLARIRAEEIDAERRTYRGRGSTLAFTPGYFYALDGHYRSQFNTEYLITEVHHFGAQGGGLPFSKTKEESPVYRNTFACIPSTIPFRPPRKAKAPTLPGILTALIESNGGEYAYVDDDGYYHFKTFFDQTDTGDGSASAPVPAMQHHSGPNQGTHFPHHKDREVIWACIDGNPDRPIVLGGRPNPNDKSPVVADTRMLNVIRTWAGNEFVMDDTTNKARIALNTPDANTMSLNDDEDHIAITTTNKHHMVMDDKNEQLKIQTTSGHFAVFDDKNKKVTLQSKVGHQICINDEDENITIVDESGENTFVIDVRNQKIVIMTENGDMDLHAPNGTIDIQAATLNIETSGDTMLSSANIYSEAQGDHEMKASNITAEASMDLSQKGMNVTSEASVDHKTKGMNVSSEAGVKQDVKGTMVTVQASGINTIKGSLVKVN